MSNDPGKVASPSKTSIFREEALRRHLEARSFGALLRTPPRWTRVGFPAILAVAGAATLLLAVARTSSFAAGAAVVRVHEEGTASVVAAFPASHRGDLRPGDEMRLSIQGAETVVPVERIDGRDLDAEEAWRALGSMPAAPAPAAPMLLVRAALPPERLPGALRDAPAGVPIPASAKIAAGSQPLLLALFPGLRAALGD